MTADQVAIAGLIIVVGTNLCALVWGASKISTRLAHLTAVANEMSQLIKHLDQTLSLHETRIRLLEWRVDNPGPKGNLP